MPILRLNAYIDAPREEVYRYVALYDADGPIDEAEFVSRYGEIVERDGDTIVVDEDVRSFEEDPPDIVRWRCSFDYPARRAMVAVDSVWADREDTFGEEDGGTRWTIRWRTKTGGWRGALQTVFFWLVQGRRLGREVFGPVREHFSGGGSAPPS